MARLDQREDVRTRWSMVLRQRPALAIAVVIVVVLVACSAVFGVREATEVSGIEIERGGAEDEGEASDSEESDRSDERDGADTTVQRIIVDVSGAVVDPKVIELEDGARVQDAIDAAGGLAADAEVAGVNRAAKLVDGQQVYIPCVGEQEPLGAGGGAAGASGGSVLVNINVATVEELDALPGVGPSTAQAIIEDREANGAFSTPEDLMRVSGIGEKKFEKLKASICV